MNLADSRMTPIEVCRGKLLIDGALLGLCIVCERRRERPEPVLQAVQIVPPALRDDLGKWACPKLIRPAGW